MCIQYEQFIRNHHLSAHSSSIRYTMTLFFTILMKREPLTTVMCLSWHHTYGLHIVWTKNKLNHRVTCRSSLEKVLCLKWCNDESLWWLLACVSESRIGSGTRSMSENIKYLMDFLINWSYFRLVYFKCVLLIFCPKICLKFTKMLVIFPTLSWRHWCESLYLRSCMCDVIIPPLMSFCFILGKLKRQNRRVSKIFVSSMFVPTLCK